jgi:hypothetical protein
MPANTKKKPANAEYLAKATVKADDPTIAYPLGDGTSHLFGEVWLSWHVDGRLKIRVRDGQPGVIRQAYLSGQGKDLIIEVAPRA